MFTRIATVITGRPRIATALLALMVLVAAAIGGSAPDRLSETPGDDFADYAAETWTTDKRLTDSRPDSGPQTLVTIKLDEPWPAASAQERVREISDVIANNKDVTRIEGPADSPALISQTGRNVLLTVAYKKSGAINDGAVDLRDDLARESDVKVGGVPIIDEEMNAQVEKDLGRAESFAFPILFLVSIWVFGSVVAALMPLLTGIATIMMTFFGLVIFNEIEPMSVFAINLVFALGLGLAVDYSLLLITRVREARAMGHEPRAAVLAAVRATATTITFSALTVAAAMAALTLFPQRFLWSMGVGGIICALLAAVMSLTLLPAVLALLGDRLNALQPKRWRRALEREAAGDSDGLWGRIARIVMRRPGTFAIVTSALLLLTASPLLRVEFTGVDASVLPAASQARQATETIAREFPLVGAAHLTVVAQEASPQELRDAVATTVESSQGAKAIGDVPAEALKLDDGLSSIDLPMHGKVNSDAARELVTDLRDELPKKVELVGVTGPTTITVDTLASFGKHLPWAALLTAVTTFVLVFLFTGSLILPLKAIIMNALSVAAALGILVVIFQDGRFEDLIGYASQGALESSQPILIVAIAFGLSTDYGIMLLARIREERMRGLSERDAVAMGIQRTGRVVTAAALLLSIALGAFVTSEIIFIKQIGVGTVAAVLIDATIVRAILVPSLMALLGRWNWWAPAPLRRLHNRIGVKEAQGIEPPAPVPAPNYSPAAQPVSV